jgi:hypothetical protein
MKFAVIILLTVVGLSAANAEPTLNDIVIAKDVRDDVVLNYPCHAFMGVIFCDSQLKVAGRCGKTLAVTEKEISCKNEVGATVIIGNVNSAAGYITDDTQPGVVGLRVKHTSAVELVTLTTPNGNYEYQIRLKYIP